MDKLLALLLLFLSLRTATSKLKLIDVRVPLSVESGSEDPVILDCDFEATPEEKGLVVKWFYKNRETIIYQWIPLERKPQVIHHDFKDKIDTSYTVSNDNLTKHRALLITELSRNLSGEYTCVVGSNLNEVSGSKEMTIYEPAKDGLKLISLPGMDTVICSAYGLFPKPEMTLTMSEGEETGKTFYENDDDDDDERVFNITSVLKFNSSLLTEPTDFICTLTIPRTTYNLTEKYTFYPDNSCVTYGPNFQLYFLAATYLFVLTLTA